jgi:hypothetical protein
MGLYRVLAVSQTDILVRSAGTPRKPTNAEKNKLNALRLIRLLHIMRLVGLSTVRFEGVSNMFDVGCYRGAGSEGGGYGGVEEGFRYHQGRSEEVLRHAWDGTFSHAGTQTGTSLGEADRNGFVCLTSKSLHP